MGAIAGYECKLYRSTSLTWSGTGLPTDLVEVSNIAGEPKLNLEKESADVTTRATNGWRARKPTLKDGSVEFEMIWDNSDTNFVAFKNAYFNGTQIVLAVLSGPSTSSGSQGLVAFFEVENFTRNEPLAGAVTASVRLVIGHNTVGPAWVTVE